MLYRMTKYGKSFLILKAAEMACAQNLKQATLCRGNSRAPVVQQLHELSPPVAAAVIEWHCQHQQPFVPHAHASAAPQAQSCHPVIAALRPELWTDSVTAVQLHQHTSL